MAMSVTVLCPNGRRVNVKVTPNTSILQIIEDACRKEKFDPDEYDLKHLHRILDTSSTVRYANIPNKSQLELLKTAVPRTASNVTVNIATDPGLRLVHEFPPNTTLWEILSHHEQRGNEGTLLPPEGGDHEPVIVYTMRRISGSQLKTTTLKSLGLTGGKCMLRHSIQKSSTSGQAHVSAPLSRPKAPKEDSGLQNHQVVHNDLIPEAIRRPVQANPPPAPQPVVPPQQQQQVHHPPERVVDVQHNHDLNPANIAVAECPDVITSTHGIVPDIIQPQNGVLQPDIVAGKGEHLHLPMPMDILEGHDGASACNYVPELEEESMQLEETVIKLGSHDAILFNMDDAPSTEFSFVDESFFQLTVDEIKGLYREQQQILRSLDDAPLMTKGMRDMEESAKVLSALNQHPITRLRIYFPDNNVIQGSFKPTESVAVVMNFLRPFLSNPSAEFTLALRHPSRVLAPEITLVAADCIPNARLYFSSSLSSPYLNEDTLAKKSSFNSACSTLKQRKQRRQMSTIASYEENATAGCSQASAPAGSTSNEASYQKRTNAHSTGAVKKVPKWFKTGK